MYYYIYYYIIIIIYYIYCIYFIYIYIYLFIKYIYICIYIYIYMYIFIYIFTSFVFPSTTCVSGGSRNFEKGGALYIGQHGCLGKNILVFRWSKKAEITLEIISFLQMFISAFSSYLNFY